MITLTCQYRLKLSKQQTQEVERILEVCRCVYNYAVSERKHWLRSRKSPVNSCSIHSEYIIPSDVPYPSYNNQSKNLTIAKKSNPNLKSVNAQVLQQTLKTLDRAFSDMKAKGYGFPRFKKQMKSFVFPVMVKKATGYYLMIVFQSQESCPNAPVGKVSLGLDAGIESFVATDTGELIKCPKFLLQALCKLKLLH